MADRGLAVRWRELRLPAALGVELVGRHAEPHRAYHDARHLVEVLSAVDWMAQEADHLDSVRLAAWFHDAVYDVHADDNEESAALLAKRRLGHAGVSSTTVAEVARLVRLTAGHDPATGDRNGMVLSDADLAILGADSRRYQRYADDVRREYGHVPDAEFRRRRAALLSGLLSRPRLYRTPPARARWESPARSNVTAELVRLSS